MGDVTHIASEAVDGHVEIKSLMQKAMKIVDFLKLMIQTDYKILN